jgi:hypothetical protein
LIQHGKISSVGQFAVPEDVETTVAFFLMKKAQHGSHSDYGNPVSAVAAISDMTTA